jgi:hypothetical protein
MKGVAKNIRAKDLFINLHPRRKKFALLGGNAVRVTGEQGSLADVLQAYTTVNCIQEHITRKKKEW